MQPSVMSEFEEKTDKCATEFSNPTIAFFFLDFCVLHRLKLISLGHEKHKKIHFQKVSDGVSISYNHIHNTRS